MAKSKKATPVATTKVLATKRSGYKRKSNKRVDVLGAQLKRIARKAAREAMHQSKEARKASEEFRALFDTPAKETGKKPVRRGAKKSASKKSV